MAVFEIPEAAQSDQTFEENFDGYVDYFGFEQEFKYVLPDGKQWISFRPLNEGERAKYEAKTVRDVKFNRRSDDASIRVNPAEDRHALIMESVTGWFMVRRNPHTGQWEPQAFDRGGKPQTGGPFHQWLLKADPKIVNDLHRAIVRANPWMTADMTPEMIDEEIAKLQELKEEVLKRQAEEKNFESR